MKITLPYLCLTLALLLTGAINTHAQVKEIPKQDFWDTRDAAVAKARTMTRRTARKIETYSNSKLDSTHELMTEYVLPDRIRYVDTESRGGKTTRTEQINIGKTIYCKVGTDPWKAGFCMSGSGTGTGSGAQRQERFTVAEVTVDAKRLRLYREFIRFENGTFWELFYFLNDEGLMVREESRGGRLDPQTTDEQSVETYEYNPKDLKIEPPVMP